MDMRDLKPGAHLVRESLAYQQNAPTFLEVLSAPQEMPTLLGERLMVHVKDETSREDTRGFEALMTADFLLENYELQEDFEPPLDLDAPEEPG